MAGWRVGMRWWLGAAFVLIACVTATLVATVSSRQTSAALRENSEDLAVGKTVAAAFAIQRAVGSGDMAKALAETSSRRGLALFVFDRRGALLTDSTSLGVAWHDVPGGRAALRSALAGHRWVRTPKATGPTVAALPLRRTPTARALVAYAPRPAAYGRSLAVFRHETLRAALWAVLVAAGVGVLAAALVARRLRGIGSSAAAIAAGNFDLELRPRLADEIGTLALSIDGMRRRLGVSFEQLRAERDRLGRLLEQLHEGVVAVDEAFAVQFANATATRLVGRSELAVASPLPETWAGVPLRELARGLFRSDAAVAESRAETPDGRVVSIVGVPAGASELAVLVLTDVTEQERRERSEREFVANASHELRTPVSAIAGAVEALQAGAKDVPEDRDRFVALIERQSTRLTRLIRSLLLLARAQTQQGELRLEPVELRPLLDDVAASTEVPEAVAVQVECPPGLAALAQRDLVEQLVANLVGNALKHMPGGDIVLRAREDGANVVLEVSDDGPGIPLEVQQRIFDRFYSGEHGRRDGFGLGLAIVREAVRALGGSVEIDSESGRGTSVRIVLSTAPASVRFA